MIQAFQCILGVAALLAMNSVCLAQAAPFNNPYLARMLNDHKLTTIEEIKKLLVELNFSPRDIDGNPDTTAITITRGDLTMPIMFSFAVDQSQIYIKTAVANYSSVSDPPPVDWNGLVTAQEENTPVMFGYQPTNRELIMRMPFANSNVDAARVNSMLEFYMLVAAKTRPIWRSNSSAPSLPGSTFVPAPTATNDWTNQGQIITQPTFKLPPTQVAAPYVQTIRSITPDELNQIVKQHRKELSQAMIETLDNLDKFAANEPFVKDKLFRSPERTREAVRSLTEQLDRFPKNLDAQSEEYLTAYRKLFKRVTETWADVVSTSTAGLEGSAKENLPIELSRRLMSKKLEEFNRQIMADIDEFELAHEKFVENTGLKPSR